MAAGKNEIITVRRFIAPRKKVFEAWTKGELLSRWWGPEGFTNIFHLFEPKPGGHWKYTMIGPDGTRYPNECVYREVKAPERIVFDHRSGHQYRATAEFADLEGATLLKWSMVFAEDDEFEKIKHFIPTANEQNMDRLQFLLSVKGGEHHEQKQFRSDTP